MAVAIDYRRYVLSTLIFAFGACMTVGISRGQEIDPNAVREEELWKYRQKKIAVLNYIPSASRRAKTLLDEYELVTLGQFVSVAEPDEDYLEPRMVIATFRIDEIYKGPRGLPEIQVELISDMLVFPGENISRYAKRLQSWKNINIQGESNKQELAALGESLQAGTISQQEYGRKKDEIEQQELKRANTGVKLGARQIAVVDGKTFYDLGGAIKRDEKYLLAVNRTKLRIDLYALEEVPLTTNIFWSNTRDEIVAALRELK